MASIKALGVQALGDSWLGGARGPHEPHGVAEDSPPQPGPGRAPPKGTCPELAMLPRGPTGRRVYPSSLRGECRNGRSSRRAGWAP